MQNKYLQIRSRTSVKLAILLDIAFAHLQLSVTVSKSRMYAITSEDTSLLQLDRLMMHLAKQKYDIRLTQM